MLPVEEEGIEPSSPACKAGILPLNYTPKGHHIGGEGLPRPEAPGLPGTAPEDLENKCSRFGCQRSVQGVQL